MNAKCFFSLDGLFNVGFFFLRSTLCCLPFPPTLEITLDLTGFYYYLSVVVVRVVVGGGVVLVSLPIFCWLIAQPNETASWWTVWGFIFISVIFLSFSLYFHLVWQNVVLQQNKKTKKTHTHPILNAKNPLTTKE